MRIALLGYGKMGKAIEEIALERGHNISAKINAENLGDWQNVSPENTDVVIEFSTPDAVLNNINDCLAKDLPVVVGTTGWYDHINEIKEKTNEVSGSVLYASNFSIGVNLFFEVNKFLAKMMSGYDQYKASMDETHHVHKLDAPSGTAITLANGITENHESYDNWTLHPEKNEKGLTITSHRIDEVPGTHQINYSSENDEIEIKHTAKSRKGFALGSVVAAEWLSGKKGFYSMSDVLNVNLR